MIGQCQRKCCSFSSPPPLPHSFLGPFPLWGMIYINYIYIYIYNRGEWPSGLRHCDQNMKVPGSKPTRHSAGLRDPTSFRGSW